ncbi:MAG: glycosyltransferase family 39 protein, partial [Anaerolineae bacterium]|nr:glycosyltransferase family 39 protein [Anaerolineae bacterium]
MALSLSRKHVSLLIALVALVLGALVVRLLVADRYLPVVDWGDELNMYTLARHWRGVEGFPQNNERLAGYSPAYIWFSMGVQELVETWKGAWVSVPEYIYPLRIIAAVAGMLTTLCMAVSGWRLGGPVAGWLAGLIWAFSPAIIPYETLAISAPLIFLMAAVAILAAILAWQRQSFRWSTLSLIAGIAAVYLKYPAVFVLIPWGLVTLALALRRYRTHWPWLVIQTALAAGSAAYLIWGYDMFRMTIPESTRFRSIIENEGPLGLVRQPGNTDNYRFSLKPFGSDALFYGGIIAGALAWIVSRWRWPQHGRRVDWRAVAILVVYAVVGIWVTTTGSVVRDISRIRFVLPVTVGWVLIWALAITQIGYTLQALLKRRAQYRIATGGIVAAVTLAFFVPAAVDLTGVIKDFRRTDSRAVLWDWSDTNVPPDGRILILKSSVLYDAYNRPWRGYDGVTNFDWWLVDDVAEETPAGWWDRGITYLALASQDMNRGGETLAAYTDDLLLLKHLDVHSGVGPSEIFFYRMLPPDQTSDEVFGNQIRLVGYDLDTDGATPGGQVYFRPYWQIVRPPDDNYSMFVHFYPADSVDILAQADTAPTNTKRLTLLWDDPAEILIGADVFVPLPDDLPPGEYRLAVGLYNWQTW